MKTITRKLTLAMAAVLLLSSCYSTGSGAMNGASMGALLGGAFGGLRGGPRGHDRGTIIGILVGGAAGAAIGHAQESKREQAYEQARVQQPQRPSRRQRRARARADRYNGQTDMYAYGQTGTYHQQPADTYSPRQLNNGAATQQPSIDANSPALQAGQQAAECPLQLRNLRFVGEDGNQTINRGETCKIIFELANTSGRTITDIVPYVFETNGNEHLELSPTARIESIRNGDAVRYTAHVKASSKLKAGTAYFCIQVSTEGGDFVTLRTFSVELAH